MMMMILIVTKESGV